MIVVTGGSGFIGSHLCRELKILGINFVVLDIKKPKVPCNFLKIDIRNREEVLGAISRGDIVVHLAALVNAHESDRKKEEYFDVNVGGTFNVIRACELKKAKKLVFASSVAVFDPTLKGAVKEEAKKNPQNFYGLTKLIGEELVSRSRVDHAILRFTNIYGKGGKGVINKFVKKAIKNRPLEIWGDGKQERDFLHVEDAVSAILLAIEKGKGTYNVSYGRNTSILELASLVKKIAGSASEIIFRRDKSEIPIKYKVSNEKIKKELGWKPKIDLESGIRRLIR